MMKYLCLVYFQEKIWDTISQKESDAITEESLGYDEELMKSGHFIAAEALDSIHTATTVRVRNGSVSTTDGPFAETKEVLGGFILIHSQDLDEAIRIASKIPLARWGSIEVRPILELQPVGG
jgi:hypothetical protein